MSSLSIFFYDYIKNHQVGNIREIKKFVDLEFLERDCKKLNFKFVDKSSVKKDYILSRILNKKLNSNWVDIKFEADQSQPIYYFYFEIDNLKYLKIHSKKVFYVYDVDKKFYLINNTNNLSIYSIYSNIYDSGKFIVKTFKKKLEFFNCI